MAITKLAEFNSEYETWVTLLSGALAPGSAWNADTKLAATYYDAQQVFFRRYDYTGQVSWLQSAEYAQSAYENYYVTPNNGQIPGFWSFTEGLTRDALLNSDPVASNAVNLITLNAAYHTNNDPSDPDYLEGIVAARENAYALIAHINNVRCGRAANTARIAYLYANAKGHIEQWAVDRTAEYCRPFMASLVARALINYYTHYSAESEIISYLSTLGDYIHETCLNPGEVVWNYTDRETGNTDPEDLEPAFDLGNLITPFLGWLWWQTGQQKWLDRGDAAFDACVPVYDQWGFYASGAYLGGRSVSQVNGKHVCQNYLWIIDYLTWRALSPVTGGGGGTSLVVYGTNDLYLPFLIGGTAAVNVASDTLEMWLVKSSYTPNAEHSSTSVLSGHEASGGSYARATLTNVTWSRSGALSTLLCDNPGFAASGADITAKYWVVATAGGTLLGWGLLWDEGEEITIPDGETHVIDVSAGLFKVRVA